MIKNAIQCDHIQFYVPNLDEAVTEWVSKFAFTPTPVDNPTPGTAVLSQGSILLVLVEPRGAGAGRDFVRTHGAGVARIGFRCADLEATYRHAVRHGAPVIHPPHTVGATLTAELGGAAGLSHTLVQHVGDAPTVHLPGIGDVIAEETHSTGGLTEVDHFAVLVPLGERESVAKFYEQAWRFDRIFGEQIRVGHQAMNSTVVADEGRGVVLTIIEPAGTQPGQVDGFLAGNGGAGVQHVAFATDDIVRTVDELGSRGVEFGDTPSPYYATLGERLGVLRHTRPELERLGILADRDHDGDLYQIFTKSTHERRTYFTEIVERDGATTFGSNNIRTLYEAKARETEVA